MISVASGIRNDSVARKSARRVLTRSSNNTPVNTARSTLSVAIESPMAKMMRPPYIGWRTSLYGPVVTSSSLTGVTKGLILSRKDINPVTTKAGPPMNAQTFMIP